MDRASDSGSECWGFESLRAYHKGASLRLAPLFFGDIRNHGDGSCDRAFPIPGGRWHGAAMTDEGDPRKFSGHRRADTEVRPYRYYGNHLLQKIGTSDNACSDVVTQRRFELRTPCLKGRCSAN